MSRFVLTVFLLQTKLPFLLSFCNFFNVCTKPCETCFCPGSDTADFVKKNFQKSWRVSKYAAWSAFKLSCVACVESARTPAETYKSLIGLKSRATFCLFRTNILKWLNVRCYNLGSKLKLQIYFGAALSKLKLL